MLLLVAVWAFAEAVLFFLVADVPISFVALRHGWRAGAIAAFVAALAATAGGAVAYGWAVADPAGAEAAMLALPAIDSALVTETRANLATGAVAAMFWGSLTGIPYKLYALAAASGDVAFASFLLASPFVRLPRFLIAAFGTAAISRLLSGRIGMWGRLAILATFWIAFYAWYFSVMSG
jgi:hypothetical protein